MNLSRGHEWKSHRWKTAICMVLVFLLGLTGCSDSRPARAEIDETAFRRAESFRREDRHREALTQYLRLIDERVTAPESHLNAGILYLDRFSDPVAAIYHFRRYLEQDPGSDREETVRQLMDTARKQFAAQLPGEPFAGDLDRLDLLEQVESMRKENTDLKRRIVAAERERNEAVREMESLRGEIARARQRAATAQDLAVAAVEERAVQETTPVPEEETRPESYLVQPGDTLSSISIQIYGTSARWTDLFEANRDLLPSPHALRPGQELRVP